MKKSKITSNSSKVPNPFSIGAHNTEWTGVAILMHWMREIIEQNNIDLGLPNVETSGIDGKRPDAVIYESRKSRKILVEIEAKPPYYDVFDEEDLKEPAREKASKRKAKYFVTTNFKQLIWYDTDKVNSMAPEEEQIIEKYTLSEIENLDDLEQTRYSEPTKKALESFIKKLYSIYTGKEPRPKHAIDEYLIFRLQEKVRVLASYYRNIIENKCHKDPSFAKKLQKWFIEQGWSFAWQPQDFDKAARQTAYLLINKILFYNLLQAKRPQDIDPLEIPKSLTKGDLLKKILQGYFEQVLKIDYQTIYTTDFIDSIAFPDSKEVVKEIKKLINVLKTYDFSKLGYDVIGRIFEHLIPPNERHNLGQYFTNPDIVDLILSFCLHNEKDKVLDPACGAGTFLVRAYQYKKIMNLRLKHEDILDTLWGVDIAKFPAHLSTINLAINDLGVDKNYPDILHKDFFDLRVGVNGFDPVTWRKARAKTLGITEREVVFPRRFDAIVGNPPYTRQEEMGEIFPEEESYKEELIRKALTFNNNKKIANISKRAGIYAYFFAHGTKFLKDKGYFGFVVSNSWLDVQYGKGLQELFLENYKIIAIIESKVERWFEEADINTCIVILQKCKDKKERDENFVRFVYLKKPLRHFIPPAQDMWEKKVERFHEIEKLKKTILAHNDFYENDELRIFPISQKELWDEGYDFENKKYVGSKWGKYLRAPEIFFKILEKGKGKLIPLKKIADIRRGFTTGANEFFYLTEEEIKKRKIEKEFWMHKDEKGNWVPNYVIKSPRECKSIVINPKDLKYRVLMIHKDKKDLKGTNVLKYIEEGERKGFHKRPTCASRERWYELPKITADILSKRFIDTAFTFFLNPDALFVGDTFFSISFKDKECGNAIGALLNSSLWSFITEIYGRTVMGQGVLLIYGPEIEPMPVLDVSQFTAQQRKILKETLDILSMRPASQIFDELGVSSPEEVSLDKVKPDRRKLDKIVMGEILGLTDEEQIEVYRAVIDLVKSRIKKAKSFGKKKKTKGGIDINSLVKTVMKEIGEETLGKFYKEKILNQKSLKSTTLPNASGKVSIERKLFDKWVLSIGKEYIECDSEEEAQYLKVFVGTGLSEVKIPTDKDYIKNILPELERLKLKAEKVINSYLESIVDKKTREILSHSIWAKVISEENSVK